MAKKHINKISHIRSVISEQINRLRTIQEREGDSLLLQDEIAIARAIAYLSTVAISAMKEGEIEEKLKEIEELLKFQ